MTDEQTAAAIVAEHMDFDCEVAGYATSTRVRNLAAKSLENKNAMEAAIVRALQQARKAPAGHIIDDQGVVRRVLGTLPVTADGCVAGHGAVVSFACENYRMVMESQPAKYSWNHKACISWGGPDHGAELVSDCHSVREAAEAAKEAKK